MWHAQCETYQSWMQNLCPGQASSTQVLHLVYTNWPMFWGVCSLQNIQLKVCISHLSITCHSPLGNLSVCNSLLTGPPVSCTVCSQHHSQRDLLKQAGSCHSSTQSLPGRSKTHGPTDRVGGEGQCKTKKMPLQVLKLSFSFLSWPL